MRNLVLVAVAAALVLALAVPVHAGETYISLNGGVFQPSNDYPDDYDPGIAGGLSYILVNEYAGFEIGLNGYTLSSDLYNEDVSSFGVEMLVHFHKTDSLIRPFAAVGLGRYKTTLDSKDEYNTTTSEKYDSSGGVLKAGLRMFFTENFFMGVYYKALTNKTDMYGFTYDLGGGIICFEMGIADF